MEDRRLETHVRVEDRSIARNIIFHYTPQFISGIDGHVSSDQPVPKGKTVLHTDGLGDLSARPVSWPVRDLTGFHPAGNPADFQRGISETFYGSSAVQLQGCTAGMHIHSYSSPVSGPCKYRLAQFLYSWPQEVFPWRYGSESRLCVGHYAAVPGSWVGDGSINYAYTVTAVLDVSTGKHLWIHMAQYDSRGNKMFVEIPTWWEEANSAIALGYYGGERYSSLMPTSHRATGQTWDDWRYYGLYISRDHLETMVNEANRRFRDLRLSADPDNYRLELFGIGPEMYTGGGVHGYMSMRIRDVWVFTWLSPWRHYRVMEKQLPRASSAPEVLQPRPCFGCTHPPRLLIITGESLGSRMAGPGIRAWEMACALAERFDVTLAAPGDPARSHPRLHVVGYEPDPFYPSLDSYVHNADVVLAMGSLFARTPRLWGLDKPTIVDLDDASELERLVRSTTIEQRHHVDLDVESVVHLSLESTIGDLFICASERQHDFWLGALLAAGRVNTVTYAQDPTLRRLIDVVPCGIPSQPPRKQRNVLRGVHSGIGPADKVVLWTEGLWEWCDPLTLVEALAEVLRVRDDVKLLFAAGRHFQPQTSSEMPIYAQTVARCRDLGLLDRHVFFIDQIPYDERGDYLVEADLGVSVHHPTIESRFASRTFLLDCVWASLPVIATTGDPGSDVIAARGLGRTVPPGDPASLAQAMLEMLEDTSLRDRPAGQVEADCCELSWMRAVEPVAAFLDRVAYAPDAIDAARKAAAARQTKVYIQQQSERIHSLEQGKQDLLEQMEKLRAHIEAIKQGRVMRLMSAVDRILGRS